jgi:hypothetical protein
MTAKQLVKQLNKIISTHGNLQICADHETLKARLGGLKNDCAIVDVADLNFAWIYIADDDGGIALNKNGTEKMRQCFILS